MFGIRNNEIIKTSQAKIYDELKNKMEIRGISTNNFPKIYFKALN